jgi:hypothetical protein
MKKNDNPDDKPAGAATVQRLVGRRVREIMPDKSKHLHLRLDCHHSRR